VNPDRLEIRSPMSNSKFPGKARMIAVALGTALAAFGSTSALDAHEATGSAKAINGISRYCAACWRNARLPVDRWNDCTQEVFERLLQRVPLSGWEQVLGGDGEERREFLRAIDTVKKRHQRDRARNSGLAQPVADSRDGQDRDRADERDAVWHAADQVLSARQQHILRMICEGYGVADIAAEMAMPPERVSDEKYKAIQKLRSYFEGHPDAAL
jgi:RNA polymerase sigma factor (sigma-70 family)